MSLSGALLQDTYEVGELLGSGGMGDVYLASHARLNRRFAIKILHPMFAKNAEAFARFRREAQITSALGHPHIVEVVDFNTLTDGAPYIVMECLEGVDLEQRIEELGRIPLAETLTVADRLGSALSAAHAQGVIHRDLKPQNIYVVDVPDDHWYVKILDFGISKIKGSQSIITQDNSLIGTPYYMSPEQAEGRADQIDQKTDEFALAVILYEMLTGTTPFAAESIPSVLYHVVHKHPPPVHEVVPEIPAHVGQVLARGMSKDPDDRFGTVREFVRALRGVPADVDTGRVAVTRAASVNQALYVVDPFSRTVGTGDYGATTPARMSTELPAPRSRAPVFILAAVGAIAIAAAVFFAVKSTKSAPSAPAADRAAEATEPETTPDPAAVSPSPAIVTPLVEEPGTIRVTFNTTPEVDAVTLDGKKVEGNVVELEPDDETHTAILHKAGYEDEEIEFVADESQTHRLPLDKLPAATANKTTAKKKPKRTTRVANKKSPKTKTTKATKTKTTRTTKTKKTKKTAPKKTTKPDDTGFITDL